MSESPKPPLEDTISGPACPEASNRMMEEALAAWEYHGPLPNQQFPDTQLPEGFPWFLDYQQDPLDKCRPRVPINTPEEAARTEACRLEYSRVIPPSPSEPLR